MASSSAPAATSTGARTAGVVVEEAPHEKQDEQCKIGGGGANTTGTTGTTGTTVNLLSLAASVLASSIAASEPIRRIALDADADAHAGGGDEGGGGTAVGGEATAGGEAAATSTATATGGVRPPLSPKKTRPKSFRGPRGRPLTKIPSRSKDDGSPVTDADGAAQRIIVDAVRRVSGASDRVTIVGEESREEQDRLEAWAATAASTSTSRRVPQSQSQPGGETARVDPSPSGDEEVDRGEWGWVYRFAEGEVMRRREEAEAEDEGRRQRGEEEERPIIIGGAESERPPPRTVEKVDVDPARVSVFVDPLDGTKNYTRGDFDGVTTLVAVVLDNVPCFGVICKPFGLRGEARTLTVAEGGVDVDVDMEARMRRTGCFAVYGGTLLGGAYVAGGGPVRPSDRVAPPRPRPPAQDDPHPPPTRPRPSPKAVISSSRSGGIVGRVVDSLSREGWLGGGGGDGDGDGDDDDDGTEGPVVHVSGAGEKALRLLVGTRGEALWPFPRPGTSLWDVAAADALLLATGGALTDGGGRRMDYLSAAGGEGGGGGNTDNDGGIVASNDAGLHRACIEVLRRIDDGGCDE